VAKFTGAEGEAVSSKDYLDILALALAAMTGNAKLNETSLLGGVQGYTTVLLTLKKGSFADNSAVFGNVRKFLGADGVAVKSSRLTSDGRGVADVMTKFAKELDNTILKVEIPTALPDLPDEVSRFGNGGGNGFGRGGRDSGGNGFGRGGRDSGFGRGGNGGGRGRRDSGGNGFGRGGSGGGRGGRDNGGRDRGRGRGFRD